MSAAVAFADQLQAAASVADVALALDEVCASLGFPFHALVHHCDLAHPPDRYLFLQNYPAAWVDAYAREGLHRYDPAQRLASRRPASFAWEDLSGLTDLTARERRVLAASREAGLGEGFTVPLHAYGTRVASCSFATASDVSLPRESLPAAEALAHIAFGRLFDLLYPRWRRAPAPLPTRERECVALLAQGKTDWEIAAILGLQEETVTAYLKAARRRFGVTRRTQLAVAALAHGMLAWDEVTTWQYPL